MDFCNHRVSLEQIGYISKRKRVFLKCRILPKNLDNKGVNTRWLANMTKKRCRKLTSTQPEQAQMLPSGEKNFFLHPPVETPRMFQHHHNWSLTHSGSKLPRKWRQQKIWKLCTNNPKYAAQNFWSLRSPSAPLWCPEIYPQLLTRQWNFIYILAHD